MSLHFRQQTNPMTWIWPGVVGRYQLKISQASVTNVSCYAYFSEIISEKSEYQNMIRFNSKHWMAFASTKISYRPEYFIQFKTGLKTIFKTSCLLSGGIFPSSRTGLGANPYLERAIIHWPLSWEDLRCMESIYRGSRTTRVT